MNSFIQKIIIYIIMYLNNAIWYHRCEPQFYVYKSIKVADEIENSRDCYAFW